MGPSWARQSPDSWLSGSTSSTTTVQATRSSSFITAAERLPWAVLAPSLVALVAVYSGSRHIRRQSSFEGAPVEQRGNPWGLGVVVPSLSLLFLSPSPSPCP